MWADRLEALSMEVQHLKLKEEERYASLSSPY
jgi:hypothetical protein